jgi:hypothetical protein
MDEEITKRIIQFIGGYVEYDDKGGQYVWTKGRSILLNVRGWGAIQHLKNLPCSHEEFQDELGRFIAEAINEKIQRTQ